MRRERVGKRRREWRKGGWEGREGKTRQINYKTSAAAWGGERKKEREKTILFELVWRSDTWQTSSHLGWQTF